MAQNLWIDTFQHSERPSKEITGIQVRGVYKVIVTQTDHFMKGVIFPPGPLHIKEQAALKSEQFWIQGQ